jgi:DNA repair protein RadC
MLPREKLIELGVESLTNAELFAIILGSGTASENVFDLSRRITSQPEFRKSVLDQQVEFWTKVPGIGPTKASRLVVGVELAKRMIFQKWEHGCIKSSKDVFEHFRSQIVGKTTESFYVLCLNTKNQILLSKEIHHGFCNSVITDMKILFSTVLQTGALSFICVHNHPSGDPKPSKEDRELTQKIAQAAKVLDLNFLDHVIINMESYCSLFDTESALFEC